MCFYYDDYPEFYNVKTVKTRKVHTCHCCMKPIDVGTKCEYAAGKFDGCFYAFYVCDGCKRKQISIVAQEIRDGCNWNESWCAYEDIHDYLAEHDVPMMEGTIDECMEQVNALWMDAKAKRQALNVV